MELIELAISFIIHVDVHLAELLANYGLWVYAILFLIIFCETGLVVTPFLPGDSLLFATGMLIVGSPLDVNVMAGLLVLAAILGNMVNYTIGRFFGKQLFSNPNSRVFRQDYLDKAHEFFSRHGGKAVVLTRFIPIVRTFVPFAAGMGGMNYPRFTFYNVLGAVLWICSFLYAGYFLGNLPGVKSNMKIIVVLIIVVSVMPVIWEFWRARRQKQQKLDSQQSAS